MGSYVILDWLQQHRCNPLGQPRPSNCVAEIFKMSDKNLQRVSSEIVLLSKTHISQVANCCSKSYLERGKLNRQQGFISFWPIKSQINVYQCQQA